MASWNTREISGRLMELSEAQPPDAPRIPWGMRTVQRTIDELIGQGRLDPERVYSGGPYIFTQEEADLIIAEAQVDHRRTVRTQDD